MLQKLDGGTESDLEFDEQDVIVFNEAYHGSEQLYNIVRTSSVITPPSSSSSSSSASDSNEDFPKITLKFPSRLEIPVPAAYRTLPDEAFSPEIFLTVRGSENFLIYIWIAKDLSWTQNWYYPTIIFGCTALFCSFLSICRSVKDRNSEEVFHSVAQLMWLFSNYWWMSADVYDSTHPYHDDVYLHRKDQSCIVMITALAWLALWYLIVRPCNIFPVDSEAYKKYDDANLCSRFSYFVHWRQYENIHVLFWLGKDYSWASLSPTLWIFFCIPTILISIDFCYVTSKTKNMIIDHAHYCSQFLWVIGNFIWALGELFYAGRDRPFPLWTNSEEASRTCRFYSSWVLVSAYIPVLILYCVWLPLTCLGRLERVETQRIFELVTSPLSLSSHSAHRIQEQTNIEDGEDVIGVISINDSSIDDDIENADHNDIVIVSL